MENAMSDTVSATKDPVELALAELIERGKKRKYITWEEMNEILPDEAITPDKLEMIMLTLEEQTIEMIDESEAERLGIHEEIRSTRRATPISSDIAEPIEEEHVEIPIIEVG